MLRAAEFCLSGTGSPLLRQECPRRVEREGQARARVGLERLSRIRLTHYRVEARVPLPASDANHTGVRRNDSDRLVVLVVVLALAMLPTLAYGDPLDPTWQGGFWDDDDFDYVALLVTDLQAFLPPSPVVSHPSTERVGVLSLVVPDVRSPERRLPFHRRGPPA